MVKKRYHQSMKDRRHERMGEERYMHHKDEHNDLYHSGGRERMIGAYHEGYYEGPEMRRYQEMHDGGMIREDHSKIANLPQDVMMKPYPQVGRYLPEDLDDTIKGIDRQIDFDDSQRMKHFFPKKV